MRDNKPLEQEALSCATFKVSKYGYKFSHPNFDKNGGDFFIEEELADGLHKIILCQSKGRNITENNSNLKIHTNYVKDNFLLFLYLKDDNYDNEDTLFFFTREDIQKWEIRNENYYLNIQKNSLDNSIFASNKFNKTNSEKIADILQNINAGKKIEYKTITNLNTLNSLLVLWKTIGSLPDSNLTKLLLEDFDNYPYINIEQFIFLLCITIHNEENLEFQNSIDWAFQYLKFFNDAPPSDYILDFKTQKTTYPSFMVTYNKTYLEYIENEIEKGFKLQMGDIEEYFECYLFQSGEYFLKYARTGNYL
ncbi:hypothetical protein GN157_11420 [Flavobacterium rakeshii]|uniref:DUF4365 domain-containing protein n=1 Tax=Flavobacterium rakeshii TaxID=1038845 RepID=A0A6N8HF30_9FLAO|nr:hypothetical protein [Flavobacterium rakeshii]MUV04319.1 hypothetical protein [Flavobacterium rakeshii]